jgi:peptidoglycan/LPS O-acetylase OafA/YrhL
MAAERLVVWGSFAATLVLAVVLSERTRLRGRWPSWLVLLGDASYSLYLIQLLVMTAVIGVIPATDPVLRGSAFVVLNICIAPLVWRYIEMPLARAARRVAERALSPPERAASAAPPSSGPHPKVHHGRRDGQI